MSDDFPKLHWAPSERHICDGPFLGTGPYYLSSQQFFLSAFIVLVKTPLREPSVVHALPVIMSVLYDNFHTRNMLQHANFG